jgi:hypothetical protein
VYLIVNLIVNLIVYLNVDLIVNLTVNLIVDLIVNLSVEIHKRCFNNTVFFRNQNARYAGTRCTWFQQTLNNFDNFNSFFTKLSEIDPCEKCIDMLGGHAWQHISMACSKLEAMAIYVVKQACGNEIMPSVYQHTIETKVCMSKSPFVLQVLNFMVQTNTIINLNQFKCTEKYAQ